MKGVATLLDVNVLVALFDPDHVHHDLAHDWFAEERVRGWATCAVTEAGLVRVLSNPAYASTLHRPLDIVDRLREFRASGHHTFWADTFSLCERRVCQPAHIRGHRQVTDVHLLGLAVLHRGRLATFDRAIPIAAVRGATADTLQVIAAVD